MHPVDPPRPVSVITVPSTPVDELLTHDGRPARAVWSLDPTVAHLNHGSYGGVPRAAVAERQRLQAELEADPLRWFLGERGRTVSARDELASWLEIPAERLALVANASAGVSVALQSLPLPKDAEVLITNLAYGAVDIAVRRHAERVGASVRTVELDPAAGAEKVVDAVWDAVTDRTALLVLDHVTSGTARRLPVGPLCARARAAGIRTVVDGAHAPMLLPDPVGEADADVWVGNLHKFACAPRGTAALVARDDIADLLRPAADTWAPVSGYPERFDHLGTDDRTAWLAAPVALRTIETELGWDRVRDHATAIAGCAVAQIGGLLAGAFGEDPAVPLGMPVGPIRLVGLPDRSDGQVLPIPTLQRILVERGIAATFTRVAGRTCWRVSGHGYVTSADVDRFGTEIVPLLRGWLTGDATLAA